MTFKQFFLESSNSISIEVLGKPTSGWGMKHANTTIYDVLINNVPTMVEYGESDSYINIKNVEGKSWGNVGNLYQLLNLPDEGTFKNVGDKLIEAIKNWEFKQTLNKDTVKELGGLVDEL